MTKLTPELLENICDVFGKGLSINKCAKFVGISSRSLWTYLAKSRAGSEETIIDFMGEWVQFETAMIRSRRILLLSIQSELESRMLLGDDTVQTFQGVVQYVADIRTVGWTREERAMCGFREDGLAVDENNCVIPLTIHTPAPIAGVLRVLEAGLPGGTWTPGKKIENTITNLTRGAVRPSEMSDPPLRYEKPKIPELVVLPNLDEDDDDDLSAMLGPEPEPGLTTVSTGVSTVDEPEVSLLLAPEPERIIKDIPPVDFLAPASKPMNAQLEALLIPRSK